MRLSAMGLFVLGCLVGCDGTPDDLRTWQASDHHNAESAAPVPAQAPAAPEANGPATSSANSAPRGGRPPADPLVLSAWKQQCSRCHGMFGRGDGPEGPMLGATDLSAPDWQQAVTDDQIAAVIRNGQGKMPRFDFPQSTLAGLVKLVRMMGGRMPKRSAPAPAQPATAPAPAAPPSPSAASPKSPSRPPSAQAERATAAGDASGG